jgi:hypothetical protein
MTDACAETDCERPAAVRVHDPRSDDREVCVAHARGLSQQDGVVAAPLDGADAEWP